MFKERVLGKVEEYEFQEIDNHVHSWFGLSYSQYLTVPRSVLQSMPAKWQRQLIHLLEKLDETIDWLPELGYRYYVDLCEEKLEDEDGLFCRERGVQVPDPLMDYKRGRRRIYHNKPFPECEHLNAEKLCDRGLDGDCPECGSAEQLEWCPECGAICINGEWRDPKPVLSMEKA